MIRAERSTSQLWRDRELAEFMVKGLGTEDRIMSYKMVDSEDDRSDETYVLKRSGGQFEPKFLSGDCAVVRYAIARGMLEAAGEARFQKARTLP